MPTIKVILDCEGCWPDLMGRPRVSDQSESRIVNHSPTTFLLSDWDRAIEMAYTPEGMVSRLPSIAIRIDLPDGNTVIAETSLALFLAAADAFRAKAMV